MENVSFKVSYNDTTKIFILQKIKLDKKIFCIIFINVNRQIELIKGGTK